MRSTKDVSIIIQHCEERQFLLFVQPPWAENEWAGLQGAEREMSMPGHLEGPVSEVGRGSPEVSGNVHSV